MELRRLEEMEEVRSDAHKIRSFHKEINKVFDKNLDNCLDTFICANDLEGSDIEFWLRKYNMDLKKFTL